MSPCFVDSKAFSFLSHHYSLCDPSRPEAGYSGPACIAGLCPANLLTYFWKSHLTPSWLPTPTGMPHLACISESSAHFDGALEVSLCTNVEVTHPSCVVCVILTTTWLFLSLFFQAACNFHRVWDSVCRTTADDEVMLGTVLSSCWCGGQVNLAAVGQHQQFVMSLGETGLTVAHSSPLGNWGGQNYLCPVGSNILSFNCLRFH